jgi:hypothetical protein
MHRFNVDPFNPTYRSGFVCAFLFAALLRAVPELIAWPEVIGYDLVAFYAPVLSHFTPSTGYFRLLLSTPNYSPVLYLILVPFSSLADEFTVLRSYAIVAYGFLGAAIFLFTHKHLEWSPRQSLFASILAVSYFVTLRISLDLLKNLFGLVLLLATLGLMRRDCRMTHAGLVAALGLLLAATHQISALILLFVVLGLAIFDLLVGRKRQAAAKILSILPAALLFSMLLVVGAQSENAFASAQGVTVYFMPLNAQGTPTSPFVNYLNYYGSYSALVQDASRLFLFLYAPILPLVLVGLIRDRVLALLTLSLLPGSFSLLLFPSTGLGLWYRWMLILMIPFMVYAAIGSLRMIRRVRTPKRRVYAALIILVLVGSLGYSFAVLPPEHTLPYFAPAELRPYFPSSMLTCTIPLSDEQDAVALLQQLNRVMSSDSVLLVHESFYGWASLALTTNTTIINYHLGQPTDALPLAKQLGFKRIYWVWWLPGYEWHNYRAPLDVFKPTLESGHLAIYIYTGQ